MKNSHKKSLDDQWDNREFGASEAYVRKASREREKSIDEALELQMISIRLQKELLDALKEMAREDGIGYQPYIRQLLTRHVFGKKRRDGTYG